MTPGQPLPAALLAERPEAVREGGANLLKQIDNIRAHGVTPVVAINAFPDDHPSEHDAIRELCQSVGVKAVVATHVRDGGQGAQALAEALIEAIDESRDAGNGFHFLYPDELPLTEKIERIATRLYGADGVDFAPAARSRLEAWQGQGYGELPVCIAKTHLSLSHEAGRLGAPRGWRLPVREVRLSAGAGFVYALCGDILTLPGLGPSPAATRIDIDENGTTVGLY